MALTVEDGSGVTDADSYVSLDEADQYLEDKCEAQEWANTEVEEKEEILRFASMFLDGSYSWKGSRSVEQQGLSWPRKEVRVDGITLSSTKVPDRIKKAVFELALKTAKAPILEDVDSAPIKKESFGPFSIEYGSTENGGQKKFAMVDFLVSPYVQGGGGTISIVRA